MTAMYAKAEPLRILQLINNLDIGGAQEVVRTLSTYLVGCGYPTVVCTFRDGPMRPALEREGIRVVVLPGRRHSILSAPQFGKEILAIRRNLASVIEQYHIDVVQTHLLRSLDFLIVTLKWRFPKLLVFWTIHNDLFMLRRDQLPAHAWLLKPKQIAHRWLYRQVSRQADGFIAVSDQVERAIGQNLGPLKAPITVICNGVDTQRYQRRVDHAAVRGSLGLDPDARLLMVVGTLKEQKGHRFLIEALPAILVEQPDLHVLFAGDGPQREALEGQVLAAGLQAQIHFLGNRQDVPDLLAASDLFVLPSLWEGLPMALIEAMASGLPVLATDVSGSRQVVQSGESGLLVSPGDPVSLEQALRSLLADPQRANAMGQAARVRVEALFGARKQAEEHIQLYQQVWSRHHA